MTDRSKSLLQGAFNFRDLGGLPARDGRLTRHGVLFRSDTLQALTPEDVALLRERLRVKAVIDLRLTREVSDEGRGPLLRESGVAYINAPLEMASIEDVAPGQVLHSLYRQCLASNSLATAVARIAEQAGEPTVFHCAAGKDRTGVVAAMVLSLLDVDEEAIIADYLASAANMPRMVDRFMSWPRYRDHLAAMPEEVYRVDVGPIRHLLDTIKSEFGTAGGWATRREIPHEAIEAMRRRLLTYEFVSTSNYGHH